MKQSQIFSCTFVTNDVFCAFWKVINCNLLVYKKVNCFLIIQLPVHTNSCEIAATVWSSLRVFPFYLPLWKLTNDVSEAQYLELEIRKLN